MREGEPRGESIGDKIRKEILNKIGDKETSISDLFDPVFHKLSNNKLDRGIDLDRDLSDLMLLDSIRELVGSGVIEYTDPTEDNVQRVQQ